MLTTGPTALWLTTGAAAGDVVVRPPAVAAAPAPPGPVGPGFTGAGPTGPGSTGAAEPVGIELAGLDLVAPVVPVGVDGGGEMAVPDDVRSVGWYRFGPAPGGPGSSVLAAHVDDRVQGHGAFYRLAELEVADPVRVRLADGTELRFRVRDVQRIDKSQLPVGELFARNGPPRLMLVTCGGAFDRAAGHFRDNVVVLAEPELAPG